MTIFKITYLSDGNRVKGYLCLPEGFDISLSELNSWITGFYGKPSLQAERIAESLIRSNRSITSRAWPVLIYCRGGMGKVGSVKTSWIEQFARHDTVVFAPCYRGNEGGEGRDEFGGADQEDVNSAYRLLQSLPFVDKSQISLMGFSRGSINATQTATVMRDVHRLVIWSGVSDLAQTYEERITLRRMLKRVLGGTPVRQPEAFASRSPIMLAEHIPCPVLIIHGTRDEQVDYSHGWKMYERLMELGLPAELHTYQGYGHHFPENTHLEAVRRMFKWLGTPAQHFSPKEFEDTDNHH
ncbi:prolyl oligopeptidase family serine peptidase [Paenibacillus sp. YPG26]|uniref:alpha/beta hydrolase family protein n=1 Tax=Paenibacillus sp. YPG26 TaxID=2878915 RepID=UPI00203C8FC3|nr:prolyl oligopeptidase family serine peptidase [Paenibacillus sp. YPG26]USB32177.1 prolyl oligopeptidase family serine peptidase [Paenibacillus sp. YPG26]